MNFKVFIIMLIFLISGVLTSKVKECQAKCDSQINICIYTCASSQLRQSLESQSQCKKMCDQVNKECKSSKCYLDS
ncbi:unnamed protein product [Paramecium octaurelia]|uniref:Uncharacterized protein n=1 Tax=Paramecium octaurelia TaxID=43137 RepID=A0A8S1T3C9_PAROT|nr:unnamed protein product [Paramecium octaurelia]